MIKVLALSCVLLLATPLIAIAGDPTGSDTGKAVGVFALLFSMVFMDTATTNPTGATTQPEIVPGVALSPVPVLSDGFVTAKANAS